jgi:Rieske 2Fe-2S family protein
MADVFSELIARQPGGHALLQEFYRDPAIFDRDISRIHLGHWLCVGHASRIPNRGDYFVFEVAGESFIIVRAEADEIRALANVCRHRGSHVCYEKEGSSRVFVCPYHGWSYNLDGSLRSARYSEKGFDKSKFGLKRLHVRVIEGLIFVCCAEKPPGLADAEQTLQVALGHYGWARAKVAHRATYSVDANWKLATENYMECYHCAPAHPEFSRCHASAKPDVETDELRAEVERRGRAMGVNIPQVDHWPWSAEARGEGVSCYRDATIPGNVTGSEDGQPVAPLMGDFTDYDGGFTYIEVGPASYFLAYPDHGLMYLFIPRAPETTDMEVVWLVDEDAQEDRDYDFRRLTWMWDVTTVADKKIIEHNQQGVNSRFYTPGPYTGMEIQAQRFAEWYLREIGRDA